MPLSPLTTFSFPHVTPGPHIHTGYAYIRSPAISPYARPTPTFQDTSKPALKIEEIAYSVYYPGAQPKPRGWFGGSRGYAQWLPEPVGETVAGYERFLGKRGLGWICKSLSIFRSRFKADVRLVLFFFSTKAYCGTDEGPSISHILLICSWMTSSLPSSTHSST